MITQAEYPLGKTIVDVEEAVEIRNRVSEPDRKHLFKCIHCGEPVRPHSGNVTPHFEHYSKTDCKG